MILDVSCLKICVEKCYNTFTLMTNIKKIISQYITPSVRLRVRSTYQSLLYSGNAVFCPCCGESFRKFLPNDKRQNARCPKCHALERHRLLWLYLQRCTNFFSHS